jgi:hypothetical protein
MQIMGWSMRLDGTQPVAPCFKFMLPLGESVDDECGETYTGESSQFIRVQTVYGLCGATYGKLNGEIIAYPRAFFEAGVGPDDHCKIKE